MSDSFIPPIDDYVAPTDSLTTSDWQPDVPQERIEDEQKQNAILASSYPIMAEIADWFHEQAMDAMDITNINLESKVPVEAQVLAFQLYQSKMIEKAQEFADYRSEKL